MRGPEEQLWLFAHLLGDPPITFSGIDDRQLLSPSLSPSLSLSLPLSLSPCLCLSLALSPSFPIVRGGQDRA